MPLAGPDTIGTLAAWFAAGASVVLWIPIGYYNLTGMEFIAAGLLFAWLTVFVRMSAAYALPTREIVEGARA